MDELRLYGYSVPYPCPVADGRYVFASGSSNIRPPTASLCCVIRDSSSLNGGVCVTGRQLDLLYQSTNSRPLVACPYMIRDPLLHFTRFIKCHFTLHTT